LTEDYNLELQYRKPFLDIWEEEKDDRELGPLSERMGVRNRATGELNMTEEEKDAVSKYFLIRWTLPLLTLIQVSIMPSASTRSKPLASDWT
jgi:mRNA (guanine-N7-)-methyltransferase